jgi:phage baseplate assembly protein W
MAIETPHLKWPFRLNPSGNALEFVEQDEPPEVAQCVAFVLSTEPGTLVPNASLGLPDPAFKEGGLTEAEVVAAVTRWEPRGPVVFTGDEITRQAQTIGIEVTE